MTVEATTRKAGPFVGNGVTTVFPFAFKVFSKTDLQVIRTDNSTGNPVTLVLDSDYSVTLNPDQDSNPGGSITYPILVGPTPLPATATLTMIGDLAYAQPTDITNTGRFLPSVIENALDRLTILAQQLKEISSRSLQAAVGTTVALVFPAPSSGKFIRWRTDLTGLENADAGTDSMVLQGLLADAADVNHGTAMIGYKLNASGSASRTLTAKLFERVSLKDFGAVGNGVADDTAAIQAAINWAGPLGREIFAPRGTYKFSGVTISPGWSIQLVGEGTANTFFALSSGTAVGFNCTTNAPCVFENFTIGYAAAIVGTAGAFFSIPSSGSTNYNSRFRNLQLNAPFVGINTTGAASWVMDRVSIGEHISLGVHVQNTFLPDHGDSVIANCVMTTSVAAAVSILQRSSGGLRVVNNKIIGGAYYYQLILDNAVNTSDLLITGNSMEGSVTAGIELRRGGATGSFENITITANQFAGGPNCVYLDEPTAGWLRSVAVTGNSITVQGGTGILIAAAANFTVTGNAIRGALGTETAINIGANASAGGVGLNVLSNVALAAIVNSSATTYVAKKVLQGTVGPITCNAAYGAFFTGSAAVVFPAGLFGQIPKVVATVDGGGNGLSCLATGAGTGGVTIAAIALTSGANVSVAWRAEADY